MNSLSILFCFLAASVLTSEAFNFLGGYDGDKRWNNDRPGSFWDSDMDSGHGGKSGSKSDHKKKILEELLTKSMYAQFKAYMMMANSYKMLGDSVKLQRITLAQANGGTLGGNFQNSFLGDSMDRIYS
ncbi:uncharacterized protein LOC106884277 isoform X1 [Octopus bimaculoides]|uniref:Uncharacterized protein n=1 Tax=Octopus bimaculoides TaxID=37653 RepID=A0A0L8I541_OCTBM|nr:uncharacterized protein LOC106884277 isoform X1 [Octopus bimaculoides]|eukprot:XP_014791054.1 PREDICTED: uncharacterized protein LOC106884277 isoform X1 [Octopus bimaculoides]